MHIVDMEADDYHGLKEPYISATLIKVLLSKSPAHARSIHPFFSQFKQEPSEAKDHGTVLHSLILEGHANMVLEVGYPDFRSAAAREERDKARSAGFIPMTSASLAELREMAEQIRDRIAGHDADPPLFVDGKAEQSLFWEDRGVQCKARLDWIHADGLTVDDLKTTKRWADPTSFKRAVFSTSYDIQAAFYMRGLSKITGKGFPAFRFVFVELEPPYGVHVVQLSNAVVALANEKIDYALDVWRNCVENDVWPCYQGVEMVELPPWVEADWMERNYKWEDSGGI